MNGDGGEAFPLSFIPFNGKIKMPYEITAALSLSDSFSLSLTSRTAFVVSSNVDRPCWYSSWLAWPETEGWQIAIRNYKIDYNSHSLTDIHTYIHTRAVAVRRCKAWAKLEWNDCINKWHSWRSQLKVAFLLSLHFIVIDMRCYAMLCECMPSIVFSFFGACTR